MSENPTSIRLRERPRLDAIALKRKASVAAIVNEAVDDYLLAVGRKKEKPKAEPVAYICSDSCCVICKGFCRHECVDGYATVAEAVRAGSCAETCLSTCETFTTSPEGATKP